MQSQQNGNKKNPVTRVKRGDAFEMSTSDYDESLPPPRELTRAAVDHNQARDERLSPKGTNVVKRNEMSELGEVLFVCFMCNPLIKGEHPVLRVYDYKSTLLREIPLDRSDRDKRVFTGTVAVKSLETLRTRVAVKLRDGFTYEENVKHTQSYFTGDAAFRTYKCPASTDGVIIAAVVRDFFVTKYTRWSLNDICQEGVAVRGWVELLSWLVSRYGDISTLPAGALTLDQIVYFAGDQVRSDRVLSLPLTDLLRALPGGMYGGEPLNLGTLLQWMWLADLTTGKTQARLTVDHATFASLEQLDITDVYQAVIAVPSPDFQRAAALFVTRLAEANTAYSIAWAMLRLALSLSTQAESIVRRSPMEAVPFLPLFLLPTVNAQTAVAVFSLFPSFRVFRALNAGDFALPAAVVTNICASSTYRMPLNDAEEAVAEYQALLHFVVSDDQLLFASLASNKHIRVDSAALATLSAQERAEAAVMPLIYRLAASPVPDVYASQEAPLVAKRCRELRDFLQPSTLHADQQFVRSVYGILRALFQYHHVPGVPQAITDLASVLPATNCAGLVHRFVAYLREQCEGLVALEQELFRNLCHKPENEPGLMRKHFWDVMPKVLRAHETEAWSRAAAVVAELWKECYQRATAGLLEVLNPNDRRELQVLGFALDGADPVLQYLLSEHVRSLHDVISAEANAHPIVLAVEQGTYSRLYHDFVRHTELRVIKMAAVLRAEKLAAPTLEVLLKHPSLYGNIHFAEPTFDYMCVEKTAAKMNSIRRELSSLLVVFRDHMPQHPRFHDCAGVCVARVEEISAQLESTELREWALPDFGGGEELRLLAHRLHDAQGSLLYAWVWNQQCAAESNLNVSSDFSVAIQQWMASVSASLTQWREALAQIEARQFARANLQAILAPVVENLPETPVIPTNPIEAVQAADRHAHTVAVYIRSCVAAELTIAAKVLQLTLDTADDVLSEFVEAVVFHPQAQALVKLAGAVHCSYDAALDPLGRLFSAMTCAEGKVLEVLSAYGEVKQSYPQVSSILIGFPLLLGKLLEEGLHTLLNAYPEVSTLDQVVRRKVGEAAGQRDQMLLMALFEARKALEPVRMPTGYPALVHLRFSTVSNLLTYLATVSWCTSCLRQLVGGVGLLSDLLQGGASVASTVVLVHALIGTGEFAITVRNLDVQLTATALVDKDGARTLRSFPATELGDIPFKLCMVGVQKSADEVQIQRHFLQVMEQLKVLSQAVLTLAVAGHPNFQECALVVQGSISVDEIKCLVKEQTDKHARWQYFLSSYADVHLPLLTCFSRHQLVESLRYVGRPEHALSTANLLRTVCPSISTAEAVRLVHATMVPVVGDVVLSSKELFAQVHLLLLAAADHIVPPVRATSRVLSVKVGRLLASAPEKLKVPTKISVLKLTAADAHVHSAVVSALYIGLKKRLPASVELFCCSPETTEQAASDFIRRWAASQYFTKLLPSSAADLLFCMMNVEQLPLHIQSALVSQLHSLRKGVEVPLLFVVSVDRDTDSLLSSGLREDWVQCADLRALVESCLPVCSAFMKLELPLIQVYRGASPSCGKSMAILKDHAVSPADVDAKHRVKYAMLSVTGDTDDAVEVLKAVDRDRMLAQGDDPDETSGAIVLHLNVSSHFDLQKLNRFLMHFLVTGVLADSKGGYVVRNATDKIAIEWPSEGILADKAWELCPLLSCFKPRPIERVLDLVSYTFDACLPHSPDCLLYHVSAQEDAKLRTGVQMALAFFAVSDTLSYDKMPFCEDVPLTVVPDPAELFTLFSKQMSDNKQETESPPAGQVYRFVRFLAHQMHGLTQFSYYQWASAEQEQEDEGVAPHEHCRNYRRLAFHFARSSLQLARLLAASAVDPLAADTDDDARLNSLRFSFDSWRGMPFLIFNADGDYQAISVSDSDILSTMTAGDKFQAFRAFVNMHKSKARGSGSQSMVDLVTSGLTEEGYDPATNTSEHHALKVLLPMINEVPNYGFLIFRALQDPALLAAPSTSIGSMMHRVDGDVPRSEYHESAVQELRRHMGEEGLRDHHTFAHFQEVAREWFLRMTGSYSGQKAPFVLTKDNLIRLLTIKMRLICRVPVVFVGETGCGKTHLVNFFSQISGVRMETYNIYGGIKPLDVLREMQAIQQRAQGREVVVLLDEINSNSNVWMIKELVCDRCVLGRRIPDNVRFICIMNPRRLRNTSAVVEAHGLDYSPYQKNAHHAANTTAAAVSPMLVYEVYRSPESLMNLVWDFGMPSESFKSPKEALRICHHRTTFPDDFSRFITDELMFTENLVHWMISARLKEFHCGECIIDEDGEAQEVGLMADFARCGGDADGTARHYPYFRALLSALIDTSQRFMRTEQGLRDKSAASLRDISRVISQIPFLMDLQVRHAELYTPEPAERVDMYFRFLAVAVQASLILNYALRIVDERQRADYLEHVHTVWKQVRVNRTISPSFLPVPQEPAHIYRAFDGLAHKLCSSLLRPKGIAMNQALKENVLSLFCAVMGDEGTGIFQFIVGRPGSTKSSSLDILCASSDPSSQDPRSAFFRNGWFSVSKFLLQCTPDTTAQDILKLAQTAANAQRLKPTWRCIIVLEEVGVTLGSRHNPLMVLHGLIDRGVPMDDGTFVKLPIIGISNWQLDGSKMSRMRTTYRGNPSVHDLVKTAECIMEIAATKACAVSTDVLRRFATVFRNLVLSDSEKDISWFYGMRDFYAFVQFLQIHHSFSLTKELKIQDFKRGAAQSAQLDPHLVQWAVKVSFGGHPDKALEKRVCDDILSCFVAPEQLQAVRWARRAAVVQNAGAGDHSQQEPHSVEHLCDMCARVAHYVDKKLTATPVKDAADQVQLFNAHFVEHQSVNCRCTQLESATSFPVISVLSYCLNVYQKHLASKYRVRHVLLFNRANAGLRLLFSLGIVNKKESFIIFGRVNATETEKLDDLLLVRRCMQNGMVLILVGAHHISESLYDALNQHYVAEGEGENRVELTRLTMNGYTASFPVHSSFRCISVEQEETCRSLLPPYINRFTKAHLNYSSALSVSQLNAARSIRAKSTVDADACPTRDGASTASIDLLQLMIPGLSADTVDSLAFLVNIQKNGLTLPAAVKLCCDLLSFVIVPRRLQQLLCGLFEKLNGDLIREKVSYWNELVSCRSHSLVEDFEELQSIRAQLTSPAPHLCLFTEQVQVSGAEVLQAIQELFPDCRPLANTNQGFINLNKATDKQMLQLLAQLAEAEDHSFCCAYFDTTRVAGSSVSLLVDRFMHLVSCTDLTPCKHVVLIGLLMNSSTPGLVHDDLQLHFDPLWNFMFADEICVAQDHAVYLSSLLAADEGSSLVEVLNPSVLAACIVSRALPIAQHVESRDGAACAAVASLLTGVFSNNEDPVAQTTCDIILHNLKFVDEVKNGTWRKVALRKIKHAHSLREHLTLFLRAFAERALLQFSTELFAFKNFQTHCATDSVTRELFVQLLHSPLIISERSLSMCVDVDLPLPLDSVAAHLGSVVTEMFADPTLPVAFPFSFLVSSLLHPVARTSGREACRAKCAEVLRGLHMTPELVGRYQADILTHMLQIPDPAAQQAFMYLVDRTNQHGSMQADDYILELEDWAVIEGTAVDRTELSTKLPAAPEYQGQSGLEVLHMLTLENSSWVEAAVRVATFSTLDVAVLMAEPPSPLLGSLLRASALPSGVVPLDALTDIARVVSDEDSYLVQLHQAVTVATAQENEQVQHAAAELVQRVTAATSGAPLQCDSVSLEQAFLSGDTVALQWSKFLLPVIYRANECDPGRVLNVLLMCVHEHFKLLSRPAAGSILKKALEWWLKAQPQEAQQPDLLHTELMSCIQASIAKYGGNDGALAVLVSRCVFDICESPATVLAVLGKLQGLEEMHSSARAVLISGWLTSALYLLCEALKSELVQADEATYAEDLHETSSANAQQVSRQMEQVTAAAQNVLTTQSELVEGAVLFALRILSSGGVEIETAKRALRLGKLLPTAITVHRLCAGILREAEESPCSMHLLPGYTQAMDILQQVTAQDGNVTFSTDLLQRFDELHLSGKTAALLEVGFGTARMIGAGHFNLLTSKLLPRLASPDLQRFCLCLIRAPQELSAPLRDLSFEYRRLFVITAVLMFTSEAPVFQFYRGIALRAAASQPLHPVIADDGLNAPQLSRFLLFSANLIYQVMNTAEPPPEGAVQVHREHIVQNILTVRCPGCRTAFSEFDGCFSVTCACNCCFCGWCFAIFPDAHAHVMVCPHSLKPGDYHGSHEQFMETRRKHQLREATEYFSTHVPDNMKAVVFDTTLKEFIDLAIPVADLVASVGYTSQYCVHEITKAVCAVKAASFATAVTDEPAIAWMEAFLLLQLTYTQAPCVGIAAAQNCVQDAACDCPAANMLVDQVRTQCQQAIGDASEIPEVLSWNQVHEEKISKNTLEQLEKHMPHQFARRTRATPQMFWERIHSDERFAMLSFLSLREESLSAESGRDMVTVLNYVGEVMQVCSAVQVSRQKAATTTVAELAGDYAQLGGERLERFCEGLQRMYLRVERWECRDKQKLDEQFGSIAFDGSLPLIYLLPQSRDEGLLLNVLYLGTADPVRDDNWKGLGAAQNPVVQELVNRCQAPERTAVRRPYSLTENDLLVFHKQKQVYQHLLSLYIDPQPIVKFTDDLINLQWQVVHSAGVWGKPLLAATLPEFVYAEEQKSSVFGKLAAVADKYGEVLPLRADILTRLHHLTAQNRSAGDDLIAYLTILAAELISRAAYQVPFYLSALADLVPVALTEEQRAGQELLADPVFAELLRPQHILSLVEPLWDGALCPKCCVPLDDATAAVVEAIFRDIVHNPQTLMYAPQLRAAFRMLGLQKLCIEQVAGYYNQGFVDMLETMVVGPDIPIDQLLRSNIVGQIHTRHYEAVYKIADRVLPTAAAGVRGELAPGLEPGQAGFAVKIEELRTLFTVVPDEHPTKAQEAPAQAQPARVQAAALAPPIDAQDPPTQRAVTATGVHRWEGRGLLIDLDI